MKPTFALDILTPQRKFYSGRVAGALITLVDGQAEFLAGHDPVVASVAMGFVEISLDGEKKIACVTNGTVIVTPRSVSILVEAAEWAGEIDRSRVEGSLKRANERLAAESMLWQKDRAEAARLRALNRIAFLERHPPGPAISPSA